MMGPTKPIRKPTTPRATDIVAHHHAMILALALGERKQAPTMQPTIAPTNPKPSDGQPDPSTPRKTRLNDAMTPNPKPAKAPMSVSGKSHLMSQLPLLLEVQTALSA